MNDLIGTEKQVTWANSIREKKLKELDCLIQTLEKTVTPESANAAKQIIDKIKNVKDAAIWIVMKDEPMTSVNWIIDLFKKYKKSGEISFIGNRHDIYTIATKNDFTF